MVNGLPLAAPKTSPGPLPAARRKFLNLQRNVFFVHTQAGKLHVLVQFEISGRQHIPEPSQEGVPASDHRHKLPAGYRVGKTPVLGGLHHEYHLAKEAA